jgi:hypothetical protein
MNIYVAIVVEFDSKICLEDFQVCTLLGLGVAVLGNVIVIVGPS